jgi:hypothetical protein
MFKTLAPCAAKLLMAALGALLVLTIVETHVAAATEHQRLMRPATPQIQQMPQRMTPRLAPGTPQQMAPGSPGVVLRTHCNGTCLCKGDDCTETWRTEYCEDAPVCSADPGGANRVCTCIKKARH